MVRRSLVFEPTAFLERLAVLVPRPRINLMLYHGVLAPRAAWRADVVRRQHPSSPRTLALLKHWSVRTRRQLTVRARDGLT